MNCKEHEYIYRVWSGGGQGFNEETHGWYLDKEFANALVEQHKLDWWFISAYKIDQPIEGWREIVNGTQD